MAHIDDPRGVAIQQLREDCETSPLKILIALANVHPKMHVLNSILDHFSVDKRFERVAEVFDIFDKELEFVERQVGKVDRKFLQSPEFADAAVAAAEEAVRTASAAKIHRLASVLANGCDPTLETSDDDLSSFIHDVTQLSGADIQVLQRLSFVFMGSGGHAIKMAEDLPHGSSESPLTTPIEDAARENALTDDFHSHCFRLVGFGLAVQIPSNSPTLAGGGIRFRLSGRGRRLLALLKSYRQESDGSMA
jgi:hypothetical protein